MKVSYSNYPILESLQKGTLGTLGCFEPDKDHINENLGFFKDLFEYSVPRFRRDINFISQPFNDAAFRAHDKLMPLLMEILEDRSTPLDFCGTYVFNKVVYFYDYSLYDDHDYITIMNFSREGVLMGFVLYAGGKQKSWVTCTLALSQSQCDQWASSAFHLGALWYLFKNYAEIETKILAPSQRLKEIGCKYVNDTKLPITYLDSKWFTTLVKSDAFKVRGHFRLQPCGTGLTDRKLIYIDDFMKTGYTAPARKLQEASNK